MPAHRPYRPGPLVGVNRPGAGGYPNSGAAITSPSSSPR